MLVNKNRNWRSTKQASEWKTVWMRIRSGILLGSDLDLNCLQRLSAGDTSRHSNFLLSAGSTHPNITEKLLTRFNSLPHIFPHCEITSMQRVFHLCVKLKGGKVIIIGSPYQINKFYQYPLPGRLVCVRINAIDFVIVHPQVSNRETRG